MPRTKLSDEERARRNREANHRKYEANKQYYLDLRKKQLKREKQDRVLAKQGDAEAMARVQKLKDAYTRHARTKGIMPMLERKAITAAVRYAMAPILQENKRQKWRESYAENKLRLQLEADAGSEEAKAKIAYDRVCNAEKQARWFQRTLANAIAGDAVAQHNLWKLTPQGIEWRTNQIANGLGTGLADKHKENVPN